MWQHIPNNNNEMKYENILTHVGGCYNEFVRFVRSESMTKFEYVIVLGTQIKNGNISAWN